MYALREGRRIVIEEGLEARWARHIKNHQLPQLNAVRIPAGVDDLACRKRLLTEFGIEIGGGLGNFKGLAWRIGLMGSNSKPSSVLLLGALERVLRGNVTPGVGVAAAEAEYANG